MQVIELINSALTTLVESQSPRLDAEVILAHILNKQRSELVLYREREVTNDKITLFYEMVRRRSLGEPIAYILGYKEFYGLKLEVSGDTLIPRNDSETIIEVFQKFFPDKLKKLKVLDLGVGSGCLLLTILHLYPNAIGVGADISASALEMTRRNAKAIGVENFQLLLTDWFLSINDRDFDAIICNPPYISRDYNLQRDVVNFEPHIALFADEEGIANYKIIARQFGKYLKEDGKIFLEIGFDQKDSVSALFKKPPLSVTRDLAGNDRVLVFEKE